MQDKNKDQSQIDKYQAGNSRQSTELSTSSEITKGQGKRSIMATGKSKTLKFAGPIKILVIESKGEYCKTVWCAVGVGMSHIMIGATNMAVLLYYMNSHDIHALTCSLAYHFFSAEAILSLNYSNGWSTPMRLRHRRFVHVFLQLCAMLCAVWGTTFVILDRGVSATTHGITGIITGILAVLSILTGPIAIIGKNNIFKIIHISFGMPTFIMSSICFCAGLLTDPFQSWADTFILCFLVGLVVFYTIFIAVTPFIKCMIRL